MSSVAYKSRLIKCKSRTGTPAWTFSTGGQSHLSLSATVCRPSSTPEPPLSSSVLSTISLSRARQRLASESASPAIRSASPRASEASWTRVRTSNQCKPADGFTSRRCCISFCINRCFPWINTVVLFSGTLWGTLCVCTSCSSWTLVWRISCMWMISSWRSDRQLCSSASFWLDRLSAVDLWGCSSGQQLFYKGSGKIKIPSLRTQHVSLKYWPLFISSYNVLKAMFWNRSYWIHCTCLHGWGEPD